MIIPGMVSNSGNRWSVAGATFVLWGLVAASAVYWGMKLGSGSRGTSVPAATRAPAPADPLAVGRLLGSSPVVASAAPTPSLGSRFSLIGVVASQSHEGAALIAVDGKPPKPFRVGAAVDQGLVLQSVDARKANLGSTMGGPTALTLEIPLRRAP